MFAVLTHYEIGFLAENWSQNLFLNFSAIFSKSWNMAISNSQMNRSQRFFEITPWNFQEIIREVFQRDCTDRILIFGLKPFLFMFCAKKSIKSKFLPNKCSKKLLFSKTKQKLKILSVQSLRNIPGYIHVEAKLSTPKIAILLFI